MDLFLNILFAWIALILGVILVIIIILRVINKKYLNNNKNFIYKLNKALRKYHKTLGVLIIIVGFFHGLFSSKNIFSFNLGTITWLMTIVIALTWVFKKQLRKFKNWMYWHRVLTGAFVIILVIHITYVGGFIGVKKAYEIGFNLKEDIQVVEANTNGKYIDGTYIGVATGFGPELTVEVTIIDNYIFEVEIISHNEQSEKYFSKPMNIIPNQIVTMQSLDIDTITGATYTSIGILNATADALSKASNEEIIAIDLPKQEESVILSINEEIIEEDIFYKDGKFIGVADGFGPSLTVEVVIENGKIIDLIVLSHNERDAKYYGTPIIKIPLDIIEKQSPYVDTITGATYTSIGIINATIDALQSAKTGDNDLEPLEKIITEQRGQGKNKS